jgi:hypothetical protein
LDGLFLFEIGKKETNLDPVQIFLFLVIVQTPQEFGNLFAFPVLVIFKDPEKHPIVPFKPFPVSRHQGREKKMDHPSPVFGMAKEGPKSGNPFPAVFFFIIDLMEFADIKKPGQDLVFFLVFFFFLREERPEKRNLLLFIHPPVGKQRPELKGLGIFTPSNLKDRPGEIHLKVVKIFFSVKIKKRPEQNGFIFVAAFLGKV